MRLSGQPGFAEWIAKTENGHASFQPGADLMCIVGNLTE
jgi:hypothetical protein